MRKTILSRSLYVLCILALLLTLVGTASASVDAPGPTRPPVRQPGESANALSLNPSFAPPSSNIGQHNSAAPTALVNDGSFEFGPPPGSAWTEVTNVACEWIGDWLGVWGVGAYDGIYDFWAGGYCGGAPATSSVSQMVTIPAGLPELRFWYMAYRPDPDDADLDTAYVNVNGTPIWTLPLVQSEDTYPNWVQVVLDVSAYAGQTVDLSFGAVSQGASTGNIRFDYIETGAPLPPCVDVEVFFDDFESGYGNWSLDGLWNPENEADACGSLVAPFPSSSNDAYYGVDGACTYDTGAANSGALALTFDVDLTQAQSGNLNFGSFEQTECGGNCSYDNRYVQISTNGGATWSTIGEGDTEGFWYLKSLALPGGAPLRVRFLFDSVDDFLNSYFGWMVDDVQITGCFPSTVTAVDDSAVSYGWHVFVDVLANDSGDPPLLVQSVTQPSHGRAINYRSRVLYIPNRGFKGSDSFDYTVEDANGYTGTATVTVAVY